MKFSHESKKEQCLFHNGSNQTIRIFCEFELKGEDVIIQKKGGRLIEKPIWKGQLLALLSTLEPIDEPFPDVDSNLKDLDEFPLRIHNLCNLDER